MRRGLLAIVAVVAAVSAWPSGLVSAHAELVDSSPGSGEHLDTAPSEITLRFSEGVAVLDDSVRLLEAGTATPVELGAISADGSVLTAQLPALPDGGYVVDWKVVSSDGHPISGAFTFAVGDAEMPSVAVPDEGGGGASRWQETLLAATRAATYVGLTLVIGGLVCAATVWPEGRRQRTMSLLVGVGASIALVGTAIRLWAEAWILDVTTSTLWDFRSGKAWWALFGVAALALLAEPLVRGRFGARPLLAAAAALIAAAGVAIAFAGHGASGRAPIVGVLATVAHVGAAAIWIGGLAGLYVCLKAGERVAATVAAVRFSQLALWCVVVLVTSGVAQSIRQLHSVDAVTGSDFGVTLIVKVVLVAVLLLAARWSRRTVGEIDDDEPQANGLRRLLGVELGLAVLVFATTGWLAGASPIAEAEASGPIDVTVTDTAGASQATLTITPGTAGANSATVMFLDFAAGLPDEVTMRMEAVDGSVAPIDVDVTAMGDHAMATFQIPFSGQWQVTVSARYGDFDLRTYETVVEIG